MSTHTRPFFGPLARPAPHLFTQLPTHTCLGSEVKGQLVHQVNFAGDAEDTLDATAYVHTYGGIIDSAYVHACK